MIRVIRQTEPRARREYYCDLAEAAGETDFPRGMTFSELRALARYEKQGRKILKGERYISQFNEYGGQAYQWKASKDIFEIFCKYDLLPDI